MDVKAFMNSANIIALFKELSDTDKANVIYLLQAETPVPKSLNAALNHVDALDTYLQLAHRQTEDIPYYEEMDELIEKLKVSLNNIKNNK